MRRRRPGCTGCAVRLVMLLGAAWLLLTVLGGGVLTDMWDAVTGRSNGLPGGWTHVLLLGVDLSSGGVSRTDSMMIASVSNGGSVKLTSIMRDTLVDIEGHGLHKINAAYAFGGPRLAMDTVNRALGLNIRRYAAVVFAGFAELIDAVGGIEVSVTREEMRAINRKKGHHLEDYGERTRLDGLQALRYSRIRKIDSDYMRAGRQRRIIQALMDKARAVRNPVELVSLGRAALKAIDTNMNALELSAMGAKVMLSGSGIAQFRVPAEGTYESGAQDGIWSIRADLERNRALFREFVYG
ncbi:MAG: LCP family protein [Christensenellaceae bacterium]|nr:LCP family protein [Christensenellaceae bacterium]